MVPRVPRACIGRKHSYLLCWHSLFPTTLILSFKPINNYSMPPYFSQYLRCTCRAYFSIYNQIILSPPSLSLDWCYYYFPSGSFSCLTYVCFYFPSFQGTPALFPSPSHYYRALSLSLFLPLNLCFGSYLHTLLTPCIPLASVLEQISGLTSVGIESLIFLFLSFTNVVPLANGYFRKLDIILTEISL